MTHDTWHAARIKMDEEILAQSRTERDCKEVITRIHRKGHTHRQRGGHATHTQRRHGTHTHRRHGTHTQRKHGTHTKRRHGTHTEEAWHTHKGEGEKGERDTRAHTQSRVHKERKTHDNIR